MSSESPPLRAASLAGLVLVLALAGFGRFRLIAASSPYVLHADEPLVTRRAAAMLDTGDPNPRFFRYPSLPIYLTAGVFAATLLSSGEPIARGSGGVGDVAPFYERPAVALSARLLVASLALGAAALLGLAAARAFSSPLYLFLVPLVAALSPFYLLLSWTYVVVDVFGAFFCALAVTQVVLARSRASLFDRALLPGLLTGLAAGCKYFTGLVGLPALLVLLHERRARSLRLAVIVLATIAGFVATTPYSVLEPERFVEQVAFELDHYADEGHEGAEGEPGLPQLVRYLRALPDDFGWPLALLGLFGIAAAARRRPRETVLLLAFPLALLCFLSLLRVNFARNVVALFAFFPIFVACGAVALGELGARQFVRGVRGAAVLAPAIACLVPLALAPWERVLAAYAPPRDSRHLAAEWILAHTSAETDVLVADEVQLDPRTLPGRRVAQAPLLAFLEPQAFESWAALDPPPVLVAPAIERGSRLEDYYSPRVRRALAELELGWSGGERDVPLKENVLVHLGNPRLEVRALRRR